MEGELLELKEQLASGKQKLSRCSEAVRSDKELVLLAIKGDVSAFCFASKELKDDEETLLYAMGRDATIFEYASPRLRGKKEIAMQALRMSSPALLINYVGDKLFEDKEVMLIACKDYGLALIYASSKLKDDEEVVRVAIVNNPVAIEYASERLRDNEELARIALQSSYSFKYLSARLREKKDLILMGLKGAVPGIISERSVLDYVNEKVRLEIALTKIGAVPDNFEDAYKCGVIDFEEKKVESILSSNSEKTIGLTNCEALELIIKSAQAKKECIEIENSLNGGTGEGLGYENLDEREPRKKTVRI